MNQVTAQITGTLLAAKTATFKDDNGVDQTYGKVQVMVADMSGEFYQIQNVKVKKENFGLIPDIAASKGKTITLPLEINTYKGNVSYYLAGPATKAVA